MRPSPPNRLRLSRTLLKAQKRATTSLRTASASKDRKFREIWRAQPSPDRPALEVAAPKGSLFEPSDRAEDIARALADSLSVRKAENVAKILRGLMAGKRANANKAHVDV